MILLPYLRCVHLLIVVLILSACGSGRSGRFVGDDAYPTPTSDMPKIAARVMAPYDLSGWRFSVPIPGGGWSQRSDSFLAFARASASLFRI